MKHLLLTVALIATQLVAMAESRITGVVKSTADEAAVEYATVRLFSTDSIFISGVQTDENGRFDLKGINDGSYRLDIACVGFQSQNIAIDNLDRNVDLGTIHLSPVSQELDEVTVTASPVVRKIDRQIILPTKEQRKAATNGISLIQSLQLSRISVSSIDNTIKVDGNSAVQLRINGAEASREEVMAIRPNEVVRIEYHDNPGLRYGNAAAVLDYIVKKRDDGGNVAADLANGVTHLGWGDYNVSAKYNFGKSSIGVVANMERRDVEWIRENTESFIFPDKSIVNTEVGNPTKIKYDRINASLKYSWQDADKQMLNVSLRNNYDNTPNSFSDRNSTMHQGDKSYNMLDNTSTRVNIPSLDLYYQLNFKNDQHLYVDVVGSYLDSKENRSFSQTEVGQVAQPILSGIDGRKYSLIGEGIYERGFSFGKISAGIKHKQEWVKNTYHGEIEGVVDMNAAETYFYGELSSHIGKVNYSVGLGAMRSFNSQGGESRDSWIFRPSLSVSYSPVGNLFFRYNAYVSGYSPSLVNLNDITQRIDTYSSRRGNPDLKSVTFYTNALSVNWNICNWASVNLLGRYSYDSKPMMDATFYENGQVIRSMANHKGFHRLFVLSSIRLRPWQNYIHISLDPYFQRFISNGNDYTHTHSNFGINGSIMGVYRNWVLMAELNTSYHELWGETLTRGEKLHQIKVGYNTDNWSVGLAIINPFTNKYDQSVENYSKVAPYKQYAYSKTINRIVLLNVTFNLDFGHQHGDKQQRISNSDTDTGILSGNR